MHFMQQIKYQQGNNLHSKLYNVPNKKPYKPKD